MYLLPRDRDFPGCMQQWQCDEMTGGRVSRATRSCIFLILCLSICIVCLSHQTPCAPGALARCPAEWTPVLLCKVIDSIVPDLIEPGLPHTSRGTFPELENLSAFLCACRKVGVAEHSLFDPKDLHEKRDMQVVVRCLHVLGAAVQSTVPDFKGPFLGKESIVSRYFVCVQPGTVGRNRGA